MPCTDTYAGEIISYLMLLNALAHFLPTAYENCVPQLKQPDIFYT